MNIFTYFLEHTMIIRLFYVFIKFAFSMIMIIMKNTLETMSLYIFYVISSSLIYFGITISFLVSHRFKIMTKEKKNVKIPWKKHINDNAKNAFSVNQWNKLLIYLKFLRILILYLFVFIVWLQWFWTFSFFIRVFFFFLASSV